ncbi:hypothetical protein LPTSP2_14230 [Leptospira ellinghausenii]|uniref:NAD(P)-binding Rossmann-like domain protein n=1 Tax=Leptospira ellinghausenii TaxID=1917822 RepID=A0A2P2DC19_9LEPT|nr:NAD(P)-binding protein [Leptospira ellinghausenii]GBF42137.1 hypothetical protein LPTSP2_14230 [Leptospira ellinghausenii]
MSESDLKSSNTPIVVGSGITGASIMMMKPEVRLFDKARNAGGRVTTKELQDLGIRFDIGATMFRDQMEVNWLGKTSSYNLFEIWNSNLVSVETKQIYDNHHYYPVYGMESIAKGMLKNHPSSQSMTLKSIKQNNDDGWNCDFYSNTNKRLEQVSSKEVILTLPIPQILEIFKHSETNHNLEKWIQFLEPYNDYRKTLVSLFYWKNWKPDLETFGLIQNSKFPVNTVLERGEDWEYQSWEFIKYPTKNDHGSTLLVQFSAMFSESHFEYWMDPDKKPTPFYEEMLTSTLKEKWQAPNPDGIWNHRWKFAQAQMPLLGRQGALQLDSEEFLEWKSLCKETGIMVLGDWLFGSKIERIIGGVYFLIHNGIL